MSHLDNGDIVHDKPKSDSFTSKFERVQSKRSPAISEAIQGTSCERFNKEFGLESFSDRKWVRKLTSFYKIVKGNSPQYLSDYLKEKFCLQHQNCEPNYVKYFQNDS